MKKLDYVMNEYKNYLTSDSIIAFKIYGGGGNNRKLRCLGEKVIGNFTEDLFAPTDEDGNEIEGEYTDWAGNSVGLTAEQVRSGIGHINIDMDYNTIYTTYLRDIDYASEEAYAMAKADSDLLTDEVVAYFCDGESEENAKAIIAELGLDVEEYFEEL